MGQCLRGNYRGGWLPFLPPVLDKGSSLAPVEKGAVQLLDEFKSMSSRTMITLDQGKESEIDKYMSKFMVMETLIFKLFYFHVTYDYIFLHIMSSIPLDERKENLVKRRVELQIIDSHKIMSPIVPTPLRYKIQGGTNYQTPKDDTIVIPKERREREFSLPVRKKLPHRYSM